MTEPPLGLSGLSLPTLRAIETAVEKRTLPCPISRPGLVAAGFAEQADELEQALDELDRPAALAVMRVVIAERVHRRRSHLELVWTGPLTTQAAHRDTGVVMRQLFGRAEHEVLIGGFRFDAGADLFEPLHRVMVERGVKTTIFLDIEGQAQSAAGGPAYAAERIEEFFAKNWPFGDPQPEVYYDPRTAVAGPPWVSLHAKCVVVDERWSLVTSANFTDRAQTRNIELGVLIEDHCPGSPITSAVPSPPQHEPSCTRHPCPRDPSPQIGPLSTWTRARFLTASAARSSSTSCGPKTLTANCSRGLSGSRRRPTSASRTPTSSRPRVGITGTGWRRGWTASRSCGFGPTPRPPGWVISHEHTRVISRECRRAPPPNRSCTPR